MIIALVPLVRLPKDKYWILLPDKYWILFNSVNPTVVRTDRAGPRPCDCVGANAITWLCCDPPIHILHKILPQNRAHNCLASPFERSNSELKGCPKRSRTVLAIIWWVKEVFLTWAVVDSSVASRLDWVSSCLPERVAFVKVVCL